MPAMIAFTILSNKGLKPHWKNLGDVFMQTQCSSSLLLNSGPIPIGPGWHHPSPQKTAKKKKKKNSEAPNTTD
jgi:hypothetical protein